MSAASYVTKIHAHVGGRWSQPFWDKLSRAKKVIGDAFNRVSGKRCGEVGENSIKEVTSSPTLGTATRRSILKGFLNTKGYARFQHRLYERQVGWCRGGSRFFGRDYLWRRMRTGHLIGFATLFLASEERIAEDDALKRRMEEYEVLFHNIKVMFSQRNSKKRRNADSHRYGDTLADYKLGKCIETGCNGAVYEAEAVNDHKQTSVVETSSSEHHGVADRRRRGPEDIAIKMIFNFESSNAGDVWRSVAAEMVTCGRGALTGAKNWQNGSKARFKTRRLPPHSNIIEIKKVIFGKVPQHGEFETRHPAALPRPNGFGRTTAMFLAMKRYQSTLKDLLMNGELSQTTSNILALQLLNGVAHLERNQIAHRDLKSNNILIETDASGIPRLVIADFGCAHIASHGGNLVLTEKHDLRNGSPSVQPPEIVNCTRDPQYVLDYRKSDAWAAGLLLCEIFNIDKNSLKSRSIDGEIGDAFVFQLVKLLLKEDSNMRISCSEASTLLHLHLFGPKYSEIRNTVEPVSQWILLHAAKTIAYEASKWGKDSVICELFVNFLSALSLHSFSSSLSLWESLYGHSNGELLSNDW